MRQKFFFFFNLVTDAQIIAISCWVKSVSLCDSVFLSTETVVKLTLSSRVPPLSAAVLFSTDF